MSSHFLVDKGLALEAAFGGFALARTRPFAEPGVQPRFAPDRGFTLKRIDLAMEIDPMGRTVRGTTALSIAPLPSGLTDVVLDLDQIEVLGVEDGEGRPLAWRHDGRKLAVQGLWAGGGVVRVHTRGAPERGLYFVGATPAEPDRAPMAWTQGQDENAHLFFPCVDHPSVKVPMSLAITAPEGFSVVSNGRLVAREGNTWRWEQADPIPAYLVTIVVARLVVVEDRWRDRPLRYLAPEGTDLAVLRRVFGRTPAMMELFSTRFGVDYPWPRYDQVVVRDFIFGGMENAAATTLTDLVLTDARAALDWDADDLLAHELAHQWFGDLVTCQDWSQAWLNEGWATYAEYVWNHHARGEEEADYHLFRQLEEYLKEDGSRYRRPIVDYRFREPIDLFDRHLYEKAALVLHTLRGLLGEDAFWTGTRLYLERNAHGTVHTRDFQRALEEAGGRNLDGFFEQWVYGAGHPVIQVDIDHEDGRLTIAIRQQQDGDRVAEAFHFPFRVTVVAGGQEQTLSLPVRERERTWTLPAPEAPDRVEVDTGFGLLSDLRVKACRRLLVASLCGDRGVVGRIRAARALGEEASPAALQALARALREESFWGVRAEIARILGQKGGAVARASLLAALADPHPKARVAVVAALGEHPHPDVEEALTRLALQGDPSVQVEGEAVRALGRIRGQNAVSVAAAVLERESWGELLRARALEGMAASRDPAALPHLLAWSGEERRPRARAAAAAGLGRLADEVESVRRSAVDRLLQLGTDPSFRVQMAVIGALATARDPASAPLLERIHRGDGDGRTKRAAYEALQRIAEGRTGEEALAALRRDLEALREENRALRDRLARLEGVDFRQVR